MMTDTAPVTISIMPAQKSRLLRNSSCICFLYLSRTCPEERLHASKSIAVAMLLSTRPIECATSGEKRLLCFDPAVLYHALPLVHLALDELAEVRRAHFAGRGAFLLELSLNLRGVLRLFQSPVQPCDDGGRRARRPQQAPPVPRLLAGDAGLPDRPRPRQRRYPLLAAAA